MKTLRMLVQAVVVLGLPVGGFVLPALADHTDQPRFDIIVEANDRLVGVFPYERHLTRFGPDVGWTDGDRVAYRCAYMFLVLRGEIVGRVTFTRIEYAYVIDKYMEEGTRHYNGSLDPDRDDRQQFDDECPQATEPYEPLEGDPGPFPVITFEDATHGHDLEVRNYANVETSPGHQFKVISDTTNRVTVIGYQDRLPVMAVYYDKLSPSILLSSTFVEPQPQPRPQPQPSSPQPEPSPQPRPSPSPPQPQPGPGLPRSADLNRDGRVNFLDLLIFVEQWTG